MSGAGAEDVVTGAGDTLRLERCSLDALAARSLFELLRLRVDVFVVEQACPYRELDDVDLAPGTRHASARLDGTLVACARTLAPPGPGLAARIGRVAVHEAHRGRGIARTLLTWLLEGLEREHPAHPIALDAQVSVERVYAALGFERTSGEYVEDGIPHVRMTRPART